MKQIKTIDIHGKSWFDRANGNSYFSAIVIVNYGMEDERVIKLPFQYGYGDSYVQAATIALHTVGMDNEVSGLNLSRYCKEHNIILRKSMHENCTKKDVKSFVA